MLSRVQAKNQLFIVGSLPENKFRASKKCLEELDRLWLRSENNNISEWEQSSDSIKIAVLNIHSLLDKAVHVKEDEVLQFSDVICLSETWLKDDAPKSELDINGYEQHLNSYGCERGKGLAIFYKPDKFTVSGTVKLSDLQISCLSSSDIDILTIYRSASCKNAFKNIAEMLNPDKTTIVCGDFNICFLKKTNNVLIQSLLNLGFEQKVTTATHFQGGLIDHVYHRNGKSHFDVKVNLYSPYYTAFDHDALCITLKKNNNTTWF